MDHKLYVLEVRGFHGPELRSRDEHRTSNIMKPQRTRKPEVTKRKFFEVAKRLFLALQSFEPSLLPYIHHAVHEI